MQNRLRIALAIVLGVSLAGYLAYRLWFHNPYEDTLIDLRRHERKRDCRARMGTLRWRQMPGEETGEQVCRHGA